MTAPNQSGFSFGQQGSSAFAFGSSAFGSAAANPNVTKTTASQLPTFGNFAQNKIGFGAQSFSSTTTNPTTQNNPISSGFSLTGLGNQPTLGIPNSNASSISTTVSQTAFGQSNAFNTSSTNFLKPSTNTSINFGSPATATTTPAFGINSTITTTNTTTAALTNTASVANNNSTGFLNKSFTNFQFPTSSASSTSSQVGLGANATFGISGISSNTVTSTQPLTLGKADPLGLNTTATTTSNAFGISTLSTTVSASSTTTNTVSNVTSTASASLASSVIPTGTTVATTQPITYNQLEELINKWTHELEEQERYFLEEAGRVNQWDLTLIDNAENIGGIWEKVQNCQTEQARLEQELDFIEGQQRELETLLEPIELSAKELPPGQLHSDYEREEIFQIASNVDLELGHLLTDLREMVDQTNATDLRLNDSSTVQGSLECKSNKNKENCSNSENTDFVQQITRILNCHMHSLNWIHHNTQEIMDRLKVINTL